jgi:hypothetical protein
MSDDADFPRLQATIASLRYWVPAISHAAKVEESESNGIWQLTVRPLFREACPFILKLSHKGWYSLTLDGIAFPERPVESLDIFLPLAEAITEGHVLRRRWVSPNTGLPYLVETIVKLTNGSSWSGMLRQSDADGGGDADYGIRQDRHYLPYRRR